ncbi:C6 finger domain transcription factor iacK-like protein [Cladobotryum mycophilum]|uniref:C6 finger domain transcription factor iacK-like protein n=1 Tax=Cladobotryum mycophilum TaxID=491253 RepID=A0ABR0SPD5_9HYPO
MSAASVEAVELEQTAVSDEAATGTYNESLQNRRKSKRRVAIACTACRSQHLRCDAALPCCSRCQSLGKTCVYKDLRHSRRKHTDSENLAVPIPLFDQGNVVADAHGVDQSPLIVPGSHELQQELIFSCPQTGLGFEPTPSPSDNSIISSRPLDGFYSFFFPAHPFVLPRADLVRQFESNSDSVSELILPMIAIGSLYIHDAQSEKYKKDTETSLSKKLSPNGFSVQALMLFALALEWSGDGQRAAGVLERAKTMALAIGLNNKSFALEYGREDHALQETWRRTWWELYVLDSLFAGIRHLPTFTLWSVETDAHLPNEDECHTGGSFQCPRTLGEYDDRGFEENTRPFSTFAYLIDAARILGTTLAAGDIAGGSPSSLVKNAEANIMSWHLHLPREKRDPVRADGTVDEVLLRAHMMINTVAVHLHRPRSMLHYSTMELLCSKYAPPLPAEVMPIESQHYDRHTHKAIQAAKAFVDLLTVPSSPTAHTPFIMCMGSMAMATHLSACEYHLTGSEYAYAKDRVRVFLGILKEFENVWPQASKWSSEIRMMARAVFEHRDFHGRFTVDFLDAGSVIPENTFTDTRITTLDTPPIDSTPNVTPQDMEGSQ